MELGVFYIYLSHWFSFKAGIGEGTNNFMELSAIRLLIRLAVEKQVKNMHVLGDSQIIIKWINGINKIHNTQLAPLLDEVHSLIEQTDQVDVKHIYR